MVFITVRQFHPYLMLLLVVPKLTQVLHLKNRFIGLKTNILLTLAKTLALYYCYYYYVSILNTTVKRFVVYVSVYSGSYLLIE
jgi:hypothetical protein